MNGGTQPTPAASNLDYSKVSVAELHELLAAAEREIRFAVAAATPIKAELGRRFTPAVKGAYAAAKKEHGVVRAALEGGFEAEAEVKKDVKYDSAKLMTVASGMTWEQAQKVFKIEFSVPEKIYSALDAANPELKAKIDEARTVKYGEPKITLHAPKAAA